MLLEGSITTSELDVLQATQMSPSGLSATPVGMWLGWSLVVPSGIVVVTRWEAVWITDMVSSLAFVTYALAPSALNAVFHGVEPTGIRATVSSEEVLTARTRSRSESVT